MPFELEPQEPTLRTFLSELHRVLEASAHFDNAYFLADLEKVWDALCYRPESEIIKDPLMGQIVSTAVDVASIALAYADIATDRTMIRLYESYAVYVDVGVLPAERPLVEEYREAINLHRCGLKNIQVTGDVWESARALASAIATLDHTLMTEAMERFQERQTEGINEAFDEEFRGANMFSAASDQELVQARFEIMRNAAKANERHPIPL